MHYIPWTHTGTKKEIAEGLLKETHSIMTSGFLRMHAQDREMERIYWHLKEAFGCLLMGDKDNLYAVKHTEACLEKPYWKDDGVWEKECSCPNFAQVKRD
jgi:hypothetical protein